VYRLHAGLLALAVLSLGYAEPPIMAGPADPPMTITVVPRSASGVFRDTALVYLDGSIDAGAPDRLSRALDRLDGKIAIWLNSPGGNLFAGMQMGRIIRRRGASTHIIDHRTLRAGECYSACGLTFLGGVYRFNDNGGRYGVHRASLTGDAAGGDDQGVQQHFNVAIESYLREMGVDAGLLDLWTKAAPDQMYLLSAQQAKDLGVVNNGRKPPEWSIAASPGGTMLQGRQTTTDGSGTVFFSCDDKQTVFGSVYEAAGVGEAVSAQGWRHLLTIDRSEEIPLAAPGVSKKAGVVRLTFVLPSRVVRLVTGARQIGHEMKPPNGRASSIGAAVDVDDKSTPLVRRFLRNCLRERAK
jgi:hypothetical protein